MRADAARADRRHAVRDAVEGWRRADAVDDAALRTIAASYPDDRVRLGLGLRVLAGFATLAGGVAFAGLFYSIFGMSGVGWFVLAVVFATATEVQTGRLCRADAGAEFATAALAALFTGGWIASFDFDAMFLTICGFVLTFALAAWRWGSVSLAAVASLLGLAAAAQLASGRLIWLLAGVVAIPLILRVARSPHWPPRHRASAMAAGVVFSAGAYVATNVYSLDHRWIERFDTGGGTATSSPWRWLAIVGTILMPAAVLILGAARRERALLALGALFTAASLVTLRQYHPIGPWWLSLVLGGAACLAIAVSVRRWLHAGPARERSGFTAEPLFEDLRLAEVAKTAAVIAAMSPAARVTEQPGFEGGGGRSGGGGATGNA